MTVSGTPTCGSPPCQYYAYQYAANPALRNTSLYINTLGPQDSNGIHVEGNGGDAIYSAVHGAGGVAFRGASADAGGVIYLAHKLNGGTGFATIDGIGSSVGTHFSSQRNTNSRSFDITDSSGATAGPVLNYSSGFLTSGNIFQFQQFNSTYTGHVIDMDIGSGSSGSFSGYFLVASNHGTPKYTVDSSGNVAAGNVAVGGGSTIIYRCTSAGTLRSGQLTSVAADCGSSVDSGLRTN
jgi:hypothetical protein